MSKKKTEGDIYERNAVVDQLMSAIATVTKDGRNSPEMFATVETYRPHVNMMMAQVPHANIVGHEDAFDYTQLVEFDHVVRDSQRTCINVQRKQAFNHMLSALELVRQDLWPKQPALAGEGLSPREMQRLGSIVAALEAQGSTKSAITR